MNIARISRVFGVLGTAFGLVVGFAIVGNIFYLLFVLVPGTGWEPDGDPFVLEDVTYLAPSSFGAKECIVTTQDGSKRILCGHPEAPSPGTRCRVEQWNGMVIRHRIVKVPE